MFKHLTDQWSLYVTPGLTIRNFTAYPCSLYSMDFRTNSINKLAFIAEVENVYCAVRNESFNKITLTGLVNGLNCQHHLVQKSSKNTTLIKTFYQWLAFTVGSLVQGCTNAECQTVMVSK